MYKELTGDLDQQLPKQKQCLYQMEAPGKLTTAEQDVSQRLLESFIVRLSDSLWFLF